MSARTDVYALGCVLHAAAHGPPAVLARHLRRHDARPPGDPPPRPSETAGVPAAFDAVVARALAKRPEDRYSSARELVDAALAAAGAPAEARPPLRAAAPPARNGGRRRGHHGAAGHDRHAAPGPRRRRGARGAPPPGSAERAGPARRERWPRAPRRWPPSRALAVLLALDGGPFDSGDATGPLSAGEVRACRRLLRRRIRERGRRRPHRPAEPRRGPDHARPTRSAAAPRCCASTAASSPPT